FSYNTSPTSVQRSGQFGGLIFSNTDRIVLNCGSGDDNISVVIGAIAPFELHGNGGLDTITFNDHVGSTARGWVINLNQVIVDGADFQYDNMKAIGLGCSNSANNVAIYGISSDIDPGNQVSIALNAGNDVVSLFPHDASGNLTINGNLGIGGGADVDILTIDD